VIKVLLADDHRVVRAGLEQLLGNADWLVVVGSATDGAEAVEMAAELEPDVVLMDLSMPNMDGVEATKRIVKARPVTKVIAFTSFSDRDLILAAIDAGAVGYLLKDAEPDELLKGIKAAAQGESPLAPKAAQAVISARARSEAEPGLSPREEEVLVLVASGKANKQVARSLDISEKTVKAHLSNIFQRIGVTDRTQAALWAERHGLLKGGKK
jgi:DNA-binding NarL/FixJ family response regulator